MMQGDLAWWVVFVAAVLAASIFLYDLWVRMPRDQRLREWEKRKRRIRGERS